MKYLEVGLSTTFEKASVTIPEMRELYMNLPHNRSLDKNILWKVVHTPEV